MKYYLVGKPISSERLAELRGDQNLSATIKQYAQSHIGDNPTKTVKLYQQYAEARKSAASTNSQHFPIITVEARRAYNPDEPTWDALVWMINLESVSLVHGKCDAMKGIFHLNPEASPDHEMSTESAATAPAPVMQNEVLPTLAPEEAPQPQSSWLPSPGAFVRGAFKVVNATTALATGATFLKFGSRAVANALPGTGLDPIQDAMVKQIGLSLLTAAGTYSALRLKQIRNLQKKLIVKSGSAVATLYAKYKFPLPQPPQKFESPEDEQRFGFQRSGVEMMQRIAPSMAEMGLSIGLDSALGEGLFDPQNGGFGTLLSGLNPELSDADRALTEQRHDASPTTTQASQTTKTSSYLPSEGRQLRKSTMRQRPHHYSTRSRTRLK